MDINDIVRQVTERVYASLNESGQMTAARSAESPPKVMSAKAPELAKAIEHSVLNPDITRLKIEQACADAITYGFANVCVTPYFVRLAAERLSRTNVGICAPVGFPHAAASMNAKLAEIRHCIEEGATELDLSLNIVAIKSGEFTEVKSELNRMRETAGFRVKTKAIYEQGLLTDEEKEQTLNIIKNSGVDYVKISNALTGKAACVEDVAFVRRIVENDVKIKIDGGIKTAAKAQELLDSGADRLGCSASVKIVTGA